MYLDVHPLPEYYEWLAVRVRDKTRQECATVVAISAFHASVFKTVHLQNIPSDPSFQMAPDGMSDDLEKGGDLARTSTLQSTPVEEYEVGTGSSLARCRFPLPFDDFH